MVTQKGMPPKALTVTAQVDDMKPTLLPLDSMAIV